MSHKTLMIIDLILFMQTISSYDNEMFIDKKQSVY
jgi:hypothetical protein